MLLLRRHAPRLLLRLRRRGGVRRRGFGGKPPPPPVPPRPGSRPRPESSAKQRSSIVVGLPSIAPVPEATSGNNDGWERGRRWGETLGQSLRWGLLVFTGWGLLRWAPWARPAAARAPAPGADNHPPRERERVYPLDEAYSLGAHEPPQHAPSLAPLTLDEVSSTALGFVQEHALRQALRCLAALRPTPDQLRLAILDVESLAEARAGSGLAELLGTGTSEDSEEPAVGYDAVSHAIVSAGASAESEEAAEGQAPETGLKACLLCAQRL